MNAIDSNFHNINGYFDIIQRAIADKIIVMLSKTLNGLKKKVSKNDINNMLYNYITRQIL